ncbi:MAG: hypothetical protein AAGI92_11355 [Pseudomonadota bacterium]
MKNKVLISLIIPAIVSLQGCAAIAVADAAVGTTVFAAKTAAKTTVGAGRLAARGVKAVTPDLSRNSDPKGFDCQLTSDGRRVCYER